MMLMKNRGCHHKGKETAIQNKWRRREQTGCATLWRFEVMVLWLRIFVVVAAFACSSRDTCANFACVHADFCACTCVRLFVCLWMCLCEEVKFIQVSSLQVGIYFPLHFAGVRHFLLPSLLNSFYEATANVATKLQVPITNFRIAESFVLTLSTCFHWLTDWDLTSESNYGYK